MFIRAMDRIDELEHLDQVRSWMTTIAVFTARAHIRRRARRKWLFLFSPDHTKQRHLEPPSSDARQALREIYRTLDTLPADERIAFVLRFIEGLTLPEACVAAGVFAGDIQATPGASRKPIHRMRARAGPAAPSSGYRKRSRNLNYREAELKRAGKMIRARLNTRDTEMKSSASAARSSSTNVIRRNTRRADLGHRGLPSPAVSRSRWPVPLRSCGVMMWRRHRPISGFPDRF